MRSHPPCEGSSKWRVAARICHEAREKRLGEYAAWSERIRYKPITR